MSSRSSFTRKIIYLAAIALLLYPLHWLSHPATRDTKDSPGAPGGVLSRLREENNLSQAQLGEIDPTSVTVKLATLGLRGVAANILWEKAFEYKKKKDWTNLMATLRQITKIQPHFVNIWSSSVAWNVSYNISVEFDDYRERYRWVKKGIDFLEEGIDYNKRHPQLLWDMGWTISQKIGNADEKKQFRGLFKKDDDFHGSRPMALRDNWLVGKEWFEDAVELAEEPDVVPMRKSPLIYRSSAPMCQMNYAEALEEDGTFGEVARGAWAEAADRWRSYAGEQIPTSYRREDSDQPVIIRLGDLEAEDEAARRLRDRLDAVQPGLREKIVAEKRAALTQQQREARDTPPEKRTGKQFELAREAAAAVEVTHNEVARRITGPERKEALELAKKIAEHERLATYIRRYRNIVNFEYWRDRAELEQSPEVLAARRNIYQGDRAFSEGALEDARDAYREGMAAWRKVLDAHPKLVEDQTLGEYLMDVIRRYRRILGQLDDPFPEKFILQDVIDAQTNYPGAAPPQPTPAEKEK